MWYTLYLDYPQERAIYYPQESRDCRILAAMRKHEVIIRAAWDEEAHVWYVASSDVPGLSTEADTIEALGAKLMVMIPELVELNGLPETGSEVPIDLLIQSEQRLAISC